MLWVDNDVDNESKYEVHLFIFLGTANQNRELSHAGHAPSNS